MEGAVRVKFPEVTIKHVTSDNRIFYDKTQAELHERFLIEKIYQKHFSSNKNYEWQLSVAFILVFVVGYLLGKF